MREIANEYAVVEDCGEGPHVNGQGRYRLTCGDADHVGRAFGRWLALPVSKDGERNRAEPVIYAIHHVSCDLVRVSYPTIRHQGMPHCTDGTCGGIGTFVIGWQRSDGAHEAVATTVTESDREMARQYRH